MPQNPSERSSVPTLCVDIRPERTYFTRRGGESVSFEAVPSYLAVTDEGIVIGEEARAAGGQSVLPIDPAPTEAGAAGTSVEPEALPLVAFLRRALDWLDATGDGRGPDGEDTAGTGEAAVTGEPLSVTNTVLAVPGAYTYDDITALTRAAQAAGLSNVTVRRRPTPVALRELTVGTDRTAVVVDIDTDWCNVGVYTATPEGTQNVDARTSRPGMGRREWLAAIARTVFDRVGRDHGATVEYDQRALATLSDTVDEALREAAEPLGEAPVHVAVELEAGAELVLADRTLSENVEVDVDLDESLVYTALEEYTDALLELVETTLSAAAVGVDDVDDVVLDGVGTRFHVISDILEGYFGRTPRHPATESRGPDTSGALPALGPQPVGTVLGTETLDGFVDLGARGADALETKPLAEALRGRDRPLAGRVRTRSPTQSVGRFELVFRHPVSGKVVDRRRYTVAKIPPQEDATRALDIEVSADRAYLSEDTELDVSVAVVDGDGPGPSVESGDTAGAPWLLHHDVAAGEVPADTEPGAGEPAYARLTDPVSEVVEDVGPETLAEAIHELRTALWDWGTQREQALEPGNVDIILNDLEKRLKPHGIQFFEPEVGTEPDPRRHWVRESRQSEKEEGAILEVLKPGLEVDGHVVAEAVVAIAT